MTEDYLLSLIVAIPMLLHFIDCHHDKTFFEVMVHSQCS